MAQNVEHCGAEIRPCLVEKKLDLKLTVCERVKRLWKVPSDLAVPSNTHQVFVNGEPLPVALL